MANTAFMTPSSYATEAKESSQDLQALQAEIDAASRAMVAAASSQQQFIPGTSETVLTLQTKQLAELEAQQRANKVAKAADWENLSILLGQDVAALAHQQRGQAQKLAEDKAVSLWQDPGHALLNAFTIPWDEQALEGTQQQLESTQKSMAAVNAHVQQSAKTAEAIKESVTAESIASTAAAAESLMAQKLEAAKIESAKTRGAALTQVMQMKAHQLDAYMKQQALDDAAENREMRRKKFDKDMILLDMQLKKVGDVEKAEQQHLAFVNAALIAEGKNPLTVDRFSVYKQTSAAMLDALTKKGMELALAGRDKYTHGATIADRFAYQKTVGWQPDAAKPQQETIMAWQGQAFTAAAEASKNKSVVQVNADSEFNKRFTKEQQEIREGSPFKAPSAIIFNAQSELAKHPIWQKYITPTLNEVSGAAPLDEKLVLGAAKNAILAGEIRTSEASAFVQSVFQQAVAINNTSLDFEKIAGRKQTKYGVRIATGLMPGKTAYDLTDRVQVEAALQGMIVAEFGLSGKLMTKAAGSAQ